MIPRNVMIGAFIVAGSLFIAAQFVPSKYQKWSYVGAGAATILGALGFLPRPVTQRTGTRQPGDGGGDRLI